MATTNIAADIQNITGVGTANAQFLISAQKFVVSSIPKELLRWAGTNTTPGAHGGDSSPTTITLPQPTDNIIDVSRNGFSAEEVSESMKGFIANSASLHFATETYPKYYTTAGNGVVVKPNPSDSETAIVNYVDYQHVDDDSDLRNAVVFHACSSEFSKLASSSTGITFTQSAPVYLAPSLEAKTTFSSYTSGLSETDPGILSITAVAPVPPSSPNITSPGISTIAKPDISGNAPTYTKPSQTFDISQFETFLETEEDSELAQIQLGRLNLEMSEYQTDIQNELNEFNKESTIYQSNIQAEIAKHQTDAAEAQKEGDLTFQASIQDYTLELQKYSSDVNKYQAEVNTQISEYSQKLSQYQTELQTSLQSWQQEQNDKVTRYQAKIQDAVNKFNEENAEYQAQLQVSVQDGNVKPNHYANESKKYYEWAVTEINMYIQNNSKMINRTMAAQAAQQRA